MAKKKKFKLLVGTHSEGKKIYRAGDTVESERDLAAEFGSDKFVPEAQFQANAEEAAAEALKQERGENVTDEFEIAIEAEVEVFKKKGKWAVYEPDGTVVAGRLAKKDVEAAIEDYLSDDDDGEGEEEDSDDE